MGADEWGGGQWRRRGTRGVRISRLGPCLGDGLEVIWWEASDMAYASRTGTWGRQGTGGVGLARGEWGWPGGSGVGQGGKKAGWLLRKQVFCL